jgi:hypothetical protein
MGNTENITLGIGNDIYYTKERNKYDFVISDPDVISTNSRVFNTSTGTEIIVPFAEIVEQGNKADSWETLINEIRSWF